KEMYVEATLRRGSGAQVAYYFVASMGCIITVMLFLGALAESDFPRHNHPTNFWAKAIGATAGTLMLIPVAVRAAASLSSERDRKTFDSLLTCPVSDHEILSSKWWGSILSVRYGLWFLLTVWIIGVVTGGLHPTGLPLLCLTWSAHASLITALGIWFSLTCRSTLRATLLTFLAFLAVNLLPYFIGAAAAECLGLLHTGREPAWLAEFENWGMALPVNLWNLTYSNEGLDILRGGPDGIISALVSLIFVAVGAFGLWQLIRARFGAVTGRMPG